MTAKAQNGKRGQVAIFLVMLLTGLVFMLALNVDVFVSARKKIRLQNAADASALALARWQGITLNMLGELNIAHLVAISQSNRTAISGIVALQKRISVIGPTIGFKAANDIAIDNRIASSPDMTSAVRLISEFTGEEYGRMIDVVLKNGIRAGVDNIKIPPAGPLANPSFYETVENHDFRALCLWYGGGAHKLPDLGTAVPNLEDLLVNDDVFFGNIGASWEPGWGYANHIGKFENLARACGLAKGEVNVDGLSSNAHMFTEHQWCVYDCSEWRDAPVNFDSSHFPWLTPLKPTFSVMGGSATIRMEDFVALSSIAAQTNFITAQAAAKAFGSVYGQKVTDITPPIILPSFSFARLVPFSFGANGRYGWAAYSSLKGFPRIKGDRGLSKYQMILEKYNSPEFREAAERWYADHGHTAADGCRPPGRTPGPTGGTPYAF